MALHWVGWCAVGHAESARDAQSHAPQDTGRASTSARREGLTHRCTEYGNNGYKRTQDLAYNYSVAALPAPQRCRSVPYYLLSYPHAVKILHQTLMHVDPPDVVSLVEEARTGASRPDSSYARKQHSIYPSRHVKCVPVPVLTSIAARFALCFLKDKWQRDEPVPNFDDGLLRKQGDFGTRDFRVLLNLAQRDQ